VCENTTVGIEVITMQENNEYHKSTVLLTQYKVNIIPEHLERRIFTRLSALSVVRHHSSTSTFIPQFQH
jgi:hypothetical protein